MRDKKLNDVPDAARGAGRSALGARRQACFPPPSAWGCCCSSPKAAIADFLRALPKGVPATGRAARAGRADAGGLGGRRHLPAQPRRARSGVGGQGRLHRVYEAERPELFFKATAGASPATACRSACATTARWNVPEPELTLVINARRRDRRLHGRQRRVVARHRGREPALPAAGEGLRRLVRGRPGHRARRHRAAQGPDASRSTSRAAARTVFKGETRTARIKRPLEELVGYLFRELAFPAGAFLLDRHRHRPAARTSRCRTATSSASPSAS